MDYQQLAKTDDKVLDIIKGELRREREGLEMIPSENYCSLAVLEALASVFNTKYSEGYPGKRYYGGQEFADKAESLAIERLKKLFGAEHANVQPYSGSPANMAAYFAVMEPGDKLMGMALDQGGHLTHGHKVSFSGKLFDVVRYGVDEKTHYIDMDEIRKMAEKEKPKVIVAGATAYPREYKFKEFAEIAHDVGAYFMADIAHIAGLIIGGVHVNPFPEADIVTSTTHKTFRGPRGGVIMSKESRGKAVDRAVFPVLQGGPHDHVTAAKAVCFYEASKPEFKNYAAQIVKNCKALAETLTENGLELSTGGTDNHLVLADVTPKGLSGKQAEELLDSVGITVNKNMIPFDTRKPFDPSGIRLGTPALTSRGMKETDMKEIGELITKVLDHKDDEKVLEDVGKRVKDLCSSFPLYPELEGRMK
jgi:glycine hydroxymethyltransferase